MHRNRDRQHTSPPETNSSRGQPWSNSWSLTLLRVKLGLSLGPVRTPSSPKQQKYSKKCMLSVHRTWRITIIRFRVVVRRAAVCSRRQDPALVASCALQVTQWLASWTRMTELWPAVQAIASMGRLLREVDCILRLNWPGIEGATPQLEAVNPTMVRALSTRAEPTPQFQTSDRQYSAVSTNNTVMVGRPRAWSKSLPRVLPVYRTWVASSRLQATQQGRAASSLEPCRASRRRLWLRCRRLPKKMKVTAYLTSRARCRCSRSQSIR